MKRFKNGKAQKNQDGSPKTETVHRDKGTINPDFIAKHDLSPSTTPDEYAEFFLPFATNIVDGEERPSFQQLMKWTNTKAGNAGAGPEGTCYKDFHDFSVREIRQHVGLYIWHGLSPSPRIEYKFAPQWKDPLHGSDFIHESFGLNAERHHRHFKVCNLFMFSSNIV